MTEADCGAAGAAVVRVGELSFVELAKFLAQLGLRLHRVEETQPIPGSYWGESEAGIIGCDIYARADTPVHSLLHEACHVLVAAPERRVLIHTDASDCTREEDATCYLQLLLSARLPGFGVERAFADMDAWGYSFRLGSARAWFEHDAEDARAFLYARADLIHLLPAL